MSIDCKHIFGEQYATQFKDIYGKKCQECGCVQFDKGIEIAACGCRFENEYSSSVVLCESCSQLPCHNFRGNAP